MIERIKDWWDKVVFWWNFAIASFKNEEILFIDVLYTKGVEAYAYGTKDEGLFVSSKHYRKGWSDFELYDKKVNGRRPVDALGLLKGTNRLTRPQFLKEYVTGVSAAYVHGSMLWNEKIAQDIMAGTDGSKKFFGDTTEHMQTGFKNAMVVMNKQLELLKTDDTAKRIKDIHEKSSQPNPIGEFLDRQELRRELVK